MEMTEQQLAKAEEAIEKLADALEVSEQDIVSILKNGMEYLSPMSGVLSKKQYYFIDEMEATFGY